jgi:hypothetical protein
MLIGRALFPAHDDAGCAGALLFGLRPGHRRRGEWLKRGLLRPKSVCRLLPRTGVGGRGAIRQPDVRQGRTGPDCARSLQAHQLRPSRHDRMTGVALRAVRCSPPVRGRRRKPVMSIEATARTRSDWIRTTELSADFLLQQVGDARVDLLAV